MKSRRMLTWVILSLILLTQLVPLPGMAPKNARAASYCDWVEFVADITVPDGTTFKPGETFTKTWRLKNTGTCKWTTAYSLIYVSGEKMGTVTSVNLPSEVLPGNMVDVSVNMTAPSIQGHYQGNWQLRNAAGVLFGIGLKANSYFWVEINVSSGTNVAYDFAANAGSAAWTGSAGALIFPGTEGDAKGFALKQDKPRLENGVTDTNPGLLTVPPNAYDGWIQGVYPAFRVEKGDHFKSIVNCEYNASNCYVTFRLDYLTGSNPVRTLWSFREKYEGSYYRTDIDLSALAGQDVKFILTVLASGYATGDRALWGYPIVSRSGSVATPSVTYTGTPPTPTKTPTPTACSDRAAFIADVSIPDETVFQPGVAFKKTWRVKNDGTCTWTTSYSLVYNSGDQMGGQASVNLPSSVAPGQTVDVSADLTSPTTSGSYRGYWKLRNAAGVQFGLGASNIAFWVDIKVSTSSATGYDFVSNACSAQWISGSGTLPCPGTDGDSKGFMLKVDKPRLENGTTDSRTGLIVFPQNVYNGYIQGIYPVYTVKSGDRFQATVNCEYGAANCFVIFRLDYQIGTGTVKSFWVFGERYEGQYFNVDLNLASLAGQNVKFILTVLANGYATGDRALWVAPRIVSSSAMEINPTATVPAPTATPTETAS